MPRGSLLIPVLTAVLVVAPGCAIRNAAAPGRTGRAIAVRPLASSDWPARVEAIPLGEGDRDPLPDRLTHLGRYGEGSLYEFTDPASDDEGFTRDEYRFMLFVSSSADGESSANETLRYTYFGRDKKPHSIDLDPGENGTFVTLWVPPADKACGLVIYLGSLGGTTAPERTLVHTFHRRGWAVIAATPPGDVFAKRAFGVRGAEAVDSIAAAIARRMDGSLAERAYAVSAALELLDEWRPDLTVLPRAVVGGSIGAVSLPTVVSTMRAEVDAAVLIGGGAHLYRIIDKSPLGKARIVLIWFDPGPVNESGESTWRARTPDGDERELLGAAVLDRSRLDPYHTAPLLHGIPTLQLHAAFDAIVPARTGDLLYERLGRPERWTYPVGHFGLFFLLHFEAARIADWVEENVR